MAKRNSKPKPREEEPPPLEQPADQTGIRHTWEFTPGPDGGSEYRVRGIPTNLWRSVRARARREEVSIRSVILRCLREWVERADPARAK